MSETVISGGKEANVRGGKRPVTIDRPGREPALAEIIKHFSGGRTFVSSLRAIISSKQLAVATYIRRSIALANRETVLMADR